MYEIFGNSGTPEPSIEGLKVTVRTLSHKMRPEIVGLRRDLGNRRMTPAEELLSLSHGRKPPISTRRRPILCVVGGGSRTTPTDEHGVRCRIRREARPPRGVGDASSPRPLGDSRRAFFHGRCAPQEGGRRREGALARARARLPARGGHHGASRGGEGRQG